MSEGGQPVAYAIGHFRDPAAEIVRLQQQATVLAAAEEAVLRVLGLPETGRVLDVGCGPGFVARRIKSSRPELEIVGLDRDPEVVPRAREHIEAFEGDAQALPFSPNGFDCVYARLVLRHVPRPDVVLREMHRVLRPGGTVIVIDSDDDALLVDPWPDQFRRALDARQKTFLRSGADPLIGRKLPRLLSRAGFVDLAVRGLVVDSVSVGQAAFGRIVLSPVVDAIDQDLMSHDEQAAAAKAVDEWASIVEAFGMTTLLAVGGRKGA